MIPHKHAEILIAIAQGKTVQYQIDGNPEWFDMNEADVINPLSRPSRAWRIKSPPKPDFFRLIQVRFDYDYSRVSWGISGDGGNLKLTFDGETGKLKSAEMIK